MTEPDETAGARALWSGLDLPGLIDLHVHFLPPPIERAVWREFDTAGDKIGRPWPIRYRQPVAERVDLLRAFGVRHFTTLPYAHKPGVASYLNEWSGDFAAEVPEVLRSATFYPEPDAASYVAALVAGGVRVFKIHLQVGRRAHGHARGARLRRAGRGTPASTSTGCVTSASATTGCAPCAGATRPRCWESPERSVGCTRKMDRQHGSVARQRHSRAVENRRGADRFRLGTLVPGEAGRGASVIS